MNSKSVFVLFLLTLVILAGMPESFARPQYLTNLTAVYGGGSCGTCHVITPGQRNFNGTLFENQPDHAADPSATLAAIGALPAATTIPADTTAGAQAAPGFEVVVALAGLFACALFARWRNR